MVVGPSYLKTLLPLPPFSLKPKPSSSLSSMKIKSLIHTLVYAQVCRLIRAFSKAKSTFTQICKQNKPLRYLISNSNTTKHKYKHKKLFFGSFRLHYNWCSSHVTPVPAPVLEGCTATRDSMISAEQCEEDTVESELSGYLQWLEEKKANGNSTAEADLNEIDKLAEMFIAHCHEKFMLEKQESYRRFQEMMARSM
ncbi:myb family transcription factor family protein [Hibiscus syriacus]|uniref:Myb family transcription factor family protein n=2 Tax=Hibiscus syriacus TaxID=106335 RepID=A0A6A3D130_HIBSY|nr:myb family transcription factor family protein [Hibiscus syriacus]